jgi:hypothetical protein
MFKVVRDMEISSHECSKINVDEYNDIRLEIAEVEALWYDTKLIC